MQNNQDNLPKSVQRLIALIGLPLTVRLVSVWGGRTVTLYNGKGSLDRLTEIVGREAAQILLTYYGGSPFIIALCTDAIREVRNSEIRADFDRETMLEGLSGRASVINATVKFAPISDRTVWRILKKSGAPDPVDPRQMSLI